MKSLAYWTAKYERARRDAGAVGPVRPMTVHRVVTKYPVFGANTPARERRARRHLPYPNYYFRNDISTARRNVRRKVVRLFQAWARAYALSVRKRSKAIARMAYCKARIEEIEKMTAWDRVRRGGLSL